MNRLTIHQSEDVLGPIRCFYSKKQRKWLLDQKPATFEKISDAAFARQEQRLEQKRQMP